MPEASPDLPDDIAALQAMVTLQNEKLSIFETEIMARDYRIEKLEHQLAGLRQHRFGQRSEALDQLEIAIRAILRPKNDNRHFSDPYILGDGLKHASHFF